MNFKLPSLLVAISVTLMASTAAHAGLLTFATTFEPEFGSGRTGTGSAVVTFDEASHVLSFSGVFSGLSGVTTQAHIHCCTPLPFAGTAGIAVDSPTLPGFPIDVSSGIFASSLDLDDISSFSPAFLSASGGTADLATARLIDGFVSNTAYLNIHTTTFLGGEIRGFPVLESSNAVPEPSSLALMALSFAALGAAARKRQA